MSSRDDQGVEPWETSFEGKRVVIGLGNQYTRDDGVGLVAADELRKRDLPDVTIYQYTALDLGLLWSFRKASKVVIVDALRSGASPGTIQTYSIAPRSEPLTKLPSLHTLQLYDLFDLARQTGQDLCPVVIVGIEPKDTGPGEGLTNEVVARLPDLVETVTKELNPQ